MSEYDSLFWVSGEKLENSNSDEYETFIHLKYSSETQFDDFQVITVPEELKQGASMFPKETTISENEVEFIVSMKFLTFTDIRKGQISEIMDHKCNSQFIREISKAITFNGSIDYSTDICYIEQCINAFPPKGKYCLVEYSSGSTLQIGDFPSHLKTDNVLAVLPRLKLWYIMILKVLSDQSYTFICDVLELFIVKRNLVNVSLVLQKGSQALHILKLCSEGDNLGYIKLDYAENDIIDPEEEIKKAIKEFTKKVGIMSTLKVKLYDGTY